MTRHELQELWHSSWDGEGWIASWKSAVFDLAPHQAEWKPLPGRHSIWQNVNHVIFWRGVSICIVEGRDKPSQEQTEQMNFAEPAVPSNSSWRETLANLEKSHHDVEVVIGDPNRPIDRVKHHLLHDAYHLGQIMLLRALQGMPPIV